MAGERASGSDAGPLQASDRGPLASDAVCPDALPLSRDLRDRALVALVQLARRGFARLSLDRSLRFADRVGTLLHSVLTRERRISLEQIALVLPELNQATRAGIIRAMFRGVARSAVEVIRM